MCAPTLYQQPVSKHPFSCLPTSNRVGNWATIGLLRPKFAQKGERGSQNRENLKGHHYMATGKMAKKRSTRSTPTVFALFHLFSHVFDRCCTFLLVFALSGLAVSDRFWPSVFALFRTIRLLPFSGCHLDSPDRSERSWKVVKKDGQTFDCDFCNCHSIVF